MFRKFLLPLLAFCIVLQSSCSHKLAPEGNYQTNPVVADGKIDEWKLPLRFSNADYTLQYAITNDNKNIYICVVSKDPTTVQRILKAGMNVYLDPKGGKHKDISLVFPIRKAPDANRNWNRNRYNGQGNGTDSVGAGAYSQGSPIDGPGSAITRRANLENLLAQSDYYNTTGFVNMQNGQYGLTETKSPIRVSIGITNDNGIAYEAIIPLRNLSYNPLVTQNETRNFSVGIVLNAPSNDGRNGGGQQNGGGGGFRPSFGMGGGMGGMGMGMGMRMGGGGGRRYGGNGNNPAVKEEDNWYTFSLARGANLP